MTESGLKKISTDGRIGWVCWMNLMRDTNVQTRISHAREVCFSVFGVVLSPFAHFSLFLLYNDPRGLVSPSIFRMRNLRQGSTQ